MQRAAIFPMVSAIAAAAGWGVPALRAASPATPLQAGAVVERSLQAGIAAADEYTALLAKGQFARIVVEQRGIDVVVTAREPGGHELLKIDRPNGSQGIETVSILATSSGAYGIRVESLYPVSAPGRYLIRVAELRSARPEDSDRLSAERDIVEGQRLQQEGRLAEANRLYDDAADRFGRLGDSREQSVALFLAGIGRATAGDVASAFEIYGRARDAAKRAADRQMEARVLVRWGLREANSGHPVEAFDRLQAGTREAHEIGDWETEMEGLLNSGYAAFLLGRYQVALDCHERALQLARTAKYASSEAWAQFGFGFTYGALWESEESIRAYSDALRIWREQGSLAGQALALQGLGVTYWVSGSAQKAYDAVSQTLPVLRALGDKAGEGSSLCVLGLAEAQLGRHEAAVAHFREACAIWERIGDPRRPWAMFGLAYTLDVLGREPLRGESWQDAVSVSRHLGNRIVEAVSLAYLARSELAHGDAPSARRHAEESVALVETIRGEVSSESLRASFLSGRQDSYAILVDVLLALDRAHPNSGYDELAFTAGERGRVRALLEGIAEGRLDLSADIPTDLRRREEELDARIRALQSAPEAAAALEEAERQWEQLLAEMRRRTPRYAALRYPEPISFERAQAALDPETAMISYSVGPERVLVMVLTARGLDVRRLEIRPADLADRVENYVGLLAADASNRWGALSRGLYGDLVSPWRDRLPGSIRRLVIVPDGVLNSLPFEALARPGSPPRLLVEDFAVSYVPSATVLAELSAPRPAGQPRGPTDLLVLADPIPDPARSSERAVPGETFDVSRLPEAAAEARSISRFGGSDSEVDLGASASESRLKGRSLERFGVLHFATHALVSPRVPSRSGLLLASDRGGPGLLTVREIHQLKLRSDLVVLSACRTAQGRVLAGEGVQSLARAFFHAGARSLVASLWDVGDRRTSELMTVFYARLAAGATKADALREAKLDLLRREPGLAPRYWASFVLIGEPRGTVPLRRPPLLPRAAVWGVAAAAAVALAAWAGRRARQRRAIEKGNGPSLDAPLPASSSTVQK